MSVNLTPSYNEMLFVLDELNPYTILNIPEDSDFDEITVAYIECVKKYNPNLFTHLKGSYEYQIIENIFSKITTAFNALKDIEEKEKVDLYLSLKRKLESLAIDHALDNINFDLIQMATDKNNNESKKAVNMPIINLPPAAPLNKSKNPTASFQSKMSTTNTDVMKNTTEINMEQSMSFFLRGKRLYDDNKADHAIVAFKKAIDCFKKENDSTADISTFYSYLGLAMLKKGWADFAQAQFKIALSLNPKDEIALKNYISKDKTKGTGNLIEKLKSFFN